MTTSLYIPRPGRLQGLGVPSTTGCQVSRRSGVAARAGSARRIVMAGARSFHTAQPRVHVKCEERFLDHVDSSLCIAAPRTAQTRATPIEPGSTLEGTIAPPQASAYTALLNEGDTALFTVTQIGIDLVIDVIDPQGTTVDSVDGPTGRTGEEAVEIHAIRGGLYALRLRPYDEREPAGRYRLRLVSRRDRAATQKLLEKARQWLTRRTTTLQAGDATSPRTELQDFSRSLKGVRVLGLGEATHGSREFGDVRLALTEWLIEDLDTASWRSKPA